MLLREEYKRLNRDTQSNLIKHLNFLFLVNPQLN